MKLYLISFFLFKLILAQEQTLSIRSEFRSMYMATDNRTNLTDFSALAFGGKINLSYQFSPSLRFSSALYVSQDSGLSDIAETDSITGKSSRYESGMYDIRDLSRTSIFLLGEAYLHYKANSFFSILLGRFKLKTPLLNPEDGRMIPTLEQGILLKSHLKNSQLQLAYIHSIAPRSISEFHPIEKSIGLYPQGKRLDGSSANYLGKTKSGGLFLFNFEQRFQKHRFRFWNYYIDNVFNSIYYDFKIKLNRKLSLSAQHIHQFQLGNGGSEQKEYRYFESDTPRNVYGLKLRYRSSFGTIFIASNYTSAQGRFLFPRSWGREPLYTFQKRERSEGNGGATAYLLAFEKNFKRLKIHISYGQHLRANLPREISLNKYALPSYQQSNIELTWNKVLMIPALKVSLLYVQKDNLTEESKAAFTLNKVDMKQLNLTANYSFNMIETKL